MDASPLHLPAGWFPAGSAPERYEMGVTRPRSAALIRSRRAAPAAALPKGAFGTLMQSVAAAKFRGKRIRLSAELRTERVSGAGTVWMRIDGTPRQMLRFDNLESRQQDGILKGTTDWVRRDIVLDVPRSARSVHFGFYLRGKGKTWARNFTITEVGDDVPLSQPRNALLDQPTNLDFSELSD